MQCEKADFEYVGKIDDGTISQSRRSERRHDNRNVIPNVDGGVRLVIPRYLHNDSLLLFRLALSLKHCFLFKQEQLACSLVRAN